RVALERGRVRNSKGETARAIEHFVAAVELAAAQGLDFLQADAVHMLAIADPDQHDRWTATGLRLPEHVTDPRTLRWRIALHNNAGWHLFDQGRSDAALAEFEHAKEEALHCGTPEHVRWADEALAECRRAMH